MIDLPSEPVGHLHPQDKLIQCNAKADSMEGKIFRITINFDRYLFRRRTLVKRNFGQIAWKYILGDCALAVAAYLRAKPIRHKTQTKLCEFGIVLFPAGDLRPWHVLYL